METNYLLYNNVDIRDSPEPNFIFSSDKTKCVNTCTSQSNCQGVNILNPICNNNDNNDILQECINFNMNNGITNKTSDDLTKFNCKFLNNINNTNYVLNSDNNTTFVKKQYANNIDNINLGKKYYMKINDKYVGINNKNNQDFLVFVDDISFASIFQFDKNGNIIETKSNKCVQVNGIYLILEDCIQDNLSQQFIYENKSNTIRPLTNDLNYNLCISSADYDNVILEECNYKNNKFQAVEIESESTQNIDLNSKENFDIDFDIDNFSNLTKIDFCSNMVYKTIVTLILCGILIYFIWYLIRKKYKDDVGPELFETSSIIN